MTGFSIDGMRDVPEGLNEDLADFLLKVRDILQKLVDDQVITNADLVNYGLINEHGVKEPGSLI